MNDKTNNIDERMRAVVSGIMRKVKVHKVVCTRSVKSSRGDSFVGFSAVWDSVQDDSLQAVDSIDDSVPSQAMTVKEAAIASHMLAMQADVTAYQHAMAGGGLSEKDAMIAIRNVKTNYARLIQEEFKKGWG